MPTSNSTFPALAIISPDRGSGRDFAKSLKTASQQLDFPLTLKNFFVEISPRVEGWHLTHQPRQVADDLAIAMIKALRQNFRWLTISCNTLSLAKFIDLAWEKVIDQVGFNPQEIKLITTLNVILEHLHRSQHSTLLIGTRALCKNISVTNPTFLTFFNFPNLTDYQRYHYSNLIQEIIWRVKSLQKSDISTAPDFEISLADQQLNQKQLTQLMTKLVIFLIDLKIDELVLGCTELPAAFNQYLADQDHPHQKLPFELTDPAYLVARKIKNLHPS